MSEDNHEKQHPTGAVIVYLLAALAAVATCGLVMLLTILIRSYYAR